MATVRQVMQGKVTIRDHADIARYAWLKRSWGETARAGRWRTDSERRAASLQVGAA